ncbi:MAG: energy transducer TonB [Bacteroidia bacterium]|nr:energy transducer TonB [Bacteroidia bacterium]
MEKKKRKFIKYPEIEGGNEVFRKIIEENLVYPDEAIKNNIEGQVLLSYEVDDNGNVLNEKVIKGIGYGCDEEALRLIGLLKFKKVRNRGLRVKVTKKAKINFTMKKSQVNVSYTYSENQKTEKQDTMKPEKNSITWTIKI